MSRKNCLAMGELGDLESLGVLGLCEGVKLLGVEFDPELSGKMALEKKEAKVKQKLELSPNAFMKTLNSSSYSNLFPGW
ncbi:hypothetical protein Y1Q_0005112 [Alligator mississippiensis]|uniref:Uncharacterized protein n=1 Tax=Alligator mississippiensis TaxID=8496 RepID=A0A151MUE9_ALLMI|nr:hypothetical protein Y1Q_0005112 [Alligator mississippiensis]